MIKHIHTHNDECTRGVEGEGGKKKEKKSEKRRGALLMQAHTHTDKHTYKTGFKFHNCILCTVCSGLVQ